MLVCRIYSRVPWWRSFMLKPLFLIKACPGVRSVGVESFPVQVDALPSSHGRWANDISNFGALRRTLPLKILQHSVSEGC